MELSEVIKKNSFADNLLHQLLNTFFYLIRLFTKHNSQSNNKILLISLHKIGDSIFTIPAIKAIRDSCDPNQIYLLVYTDTQIIFKDVVNDQNIFTVDKNEFKFGNRFAIRKARKLIKEIDPGIVIDFTGSITSASLIFNSKAKRIIGINEKYFKNIYSDFIEVRITPHLVERYCDTAELFLNKKINREYFEYPTNYKNNGVILIHPFAGWAAKEWGLKKYISLTERLDSKFNTALIFPKKEVASDVIDYFNLNKIKFIETNSLEELIREIQKCSLFIGNDSGPLYLANYFGKPTFTIYGPTNPEYSKPFGNFHQEIKKNLKCSPIETQYCFLSAGRKCPSNECMKMLDEESVAKQVSDFIISLNIETKNYQKKEPSIN